MKNLNIFLDESKGKYTNYGKWDQKLVDKVLDYFKLIKNKDKYSSYEEMVEEAKEQLEKLIIAITNEYTSGYVCGALYEWFSDDKNLNLLKEQSEEDKKDFEEWYKK